jgi:hypothetical protein
VILSASYESRAQLTNAWTNAVSAHWESASWSLGVLPDRTQSIVITNAGFKSVGIFPSTSTGFSNSLTIGILAINGPTNGLNTLLLNFSGTAVPLHVLDGAFIGSNGVVANLYAGFQVEGTNGAQFVLQSGKYWEEGGTLIATNVATSVLGSSMNLTNASAVFGSLMLDTNGPFGDTNLGTVAQSGGQVRANLLVRNGIYNLIDGDFFGSCSILSLSGYFNQYGGTNVAALSIGYSPLLDQYGYGTYVLHNGVLNTPSAGLGTHIYAGGEIDQLGGLANIGALTLGSTSFGSFPGSGFYHLTNGILVTSNLYFINGNIIQVGGQNILSNSLSMFGNFDDYGTDSRFVSYSLDGGILICPSLNMGLFGSFEQSAGTNRIAQDLTFANTSYTLSGGMLLTSNTAVNYPFFVTSDGVRAGSKFIQTGGQHHISNTLTNSGSYFLSGGSLSADKIILSSGMMIISNGAVATCPGLIEFRGGNLSLYGSATETLGPALLSFDSAIDLEQGSHVLKFANSSSLVWSNASTLVISNWNGSTNGSGSDRVIFGNSAGGLSFTQLARIQFVNPTSFPAGMYPAKILATGEVVPGTQPLLLPSVSRSSLVLTWTGNFLLQTSTNILGPFSDVLNATSPYTNTDISSPNRFFRLRN